MPRCLAVNRSGRPHDRALLSFKTTRLGVPYYSKASRLGTRRKKAATRAAKPVASDSNRRRRRCGPARGQYIIGTDRPLAFQLWNAINEKSPHKASFHKLWANETANVREIAIKLLTCQLLFLPYPVSYQRLQ